ncbi:MAG: CapA family protein [Atopobiaceae bacterium]|jgi:poly-gamma-glutamate capsule biosynthesis protein CapA/YwtB (metallophosphatase superfamily)
MAADPQETTQQKDRHAGEKIRQRKPISSRLVILALAAVAVVAVLAGAHIFWRGSVTAPSEELVEESLGHDAPLIMDRQDEAPDAAAGVSEDETAKADQAGVQEISLMMVGDILKHGTVTQSGAQADGSYNFDHIFAHTKSYFEPYDIRVVNQETPAAGPELGLSGYPSFNAPYEYNDAIANAGFNVVLKASNHSMDVGLPGIHNELAYWQENYPDVHTIGVKDRLADDTSSAYDPYVFEKDGFKVALLNMTYGLNGYANQQDAVALLDTAHTEEISSAIRAAKDQADIVIVFPHWGQEYLLSPTEEQRAWAEFFAQEGVDAVVGDHPHVIEPVELLERPDGKKMPVFWSVGNFISNQNNNENLVGGMATLVLKKDRRGAWVDTCSFLPVVCHKGSGSTFTTYLLKDYTDELAQTNIGAFTNNSSATREWAKDFCQEVLGEAFNPETCELTIKLTAPDAS